ncbi:MAG: hypothetical protein NTW47_03555 [Proteobacteria bacterium]|nr:hypothetical protein [Pseudomonadota bacterium]
MLTLNSFSGATPVHAVETFKRLTAPEIRARIVGSVVTDGSHWSDFYQPSGTLDAMELGQRKPGDWKIKGNEMCVTRKARKPVEECFEIWQSGQQIEYRGDGVTLTSGILQKQ